MNDETYQARLGINRRHFFGKSATGISVAALASMLQRDGLAAEAHPKTGLPDLPHFAPKAKRVIYLFQNGAPTHTDIFDYKPRQQKMHGEPVPDEYFAGKRFSTMTKDPTGKLMLSPIEPFRQYGQSGAWLSDLMPYTATIADDLCFVKSMHTEAVNHAPAISFFL
ncbi:MAG: DUF1501 domain-containing protein, partial [Limisphaerales bacterium]